MKLLTGDQEVIYDDSILDHLFTGVVRTRVDEEKEEIINISNNLTSFSKDFDAYLPDGNPNSTSPSFNNSKIKAFGDYVKPTSATNLLTNRYTGIFRYNVNPSLYDTCRGQSNVFTLKTGGKNYYHAFHQMGYFAPPFGEVISLTEKSSDGLEKEVGSCATMSVEEYNRMHGLVSANVNNSTNLDPINVESNPINSKIGAVNAPYEECPPDNPSLFYFEEVNFEYAGGTYAGGSVGNPYNHNPVPTALDFSEMKLTSRYRITKPDQNGPLRITGVPEGSEITNPANYGTGEAGGIEGINNDLQLNNKLSYHGLCNAASLEQNMANHLYKGGSLDLIEYDPAGPLNAASVSPTFNYRDFEYWDFTYRENQDYLPFATSFRAYETDGSINPRISSRGTQLLNSNKADYEYWWENRQCPEVVDFLPWTYGATIYDCPRDYFEVPYYATKGKFGYYGTRFYVTCKTPARTKSYDVSGLKSGIPTYEVPYPLNSLSSEAQWEGAVNVDKGGAITNYYFNGLLAVADREQKYAEWMATTKAVPFWVNGGILETDPDYVTLAYNNPKWVHYYNAFKETYSGALGGISNFLSGFDDPFIRTSGAAFEEDYTYYITGQVTGSYARLTDRYWNEFMNNSRRELDPTWMQKLDNLVANYGYYFKDPQNTSNVWHDAYNTGISGREERIRTRYLLNIAQGNPVDLFPTNHIYFSFDNPEEYNLSNKWGRKELGTISTPSVNGGMDLPEINRRYFEGTFTNYGSLSGLQDQIDALESADTGVFNSPFMIGNYYKNLHCAKDEPAKSFQSVTNGQFRDTQNPTQIGTVNGWLGVGYNEIGKIDNNFSCFTPIFIQQPKNVYCKLGQQPTMRALALDYHTLPEDKIETKYPEVFYWAQQLKLVDTDNNLLYPMHYKWFRVPVTHYEEVMKGDYTIPQIEWASTEGDWGCLEGDDSADCTFIHPDECLGPGLGQDGYIDSNASSYMFLQGVKDNDASSYVYFCMASGRFGIRNSDPFIIEADKFVSINLSYINGGGAQGSSVEPTVSFVASTVNGDETISFEKVPSSVPTLSQPFQGVQPSRTPYEETLKKKRYMRVGGGQNVATAFGGSWIYHSTTRSYAPETIDDPRGLEATNARPIEFGTLFEYRATLDNAKGSYLYGYKHLPVCRDGRMQDGEKGVRLDVKVNGDVVKHPRVDDVAQLGMTNPPAPSRVSAAGYISKVPNIGHPGQLYGFYEGFTSIGVTSTWQMHQNMGAVKRFGRSSEYNDGNGPDFIYVNDISATDQQASLDAFNYVKDVIVTDSTLAGSNCGYLENSLGRHMLYYVEAFDRFYNFCDSKAKFNSRNPAFVAPGLRLGDAPFQYTWIGQPSDTYLKRFAMYGPYAYQWKVMRHNRDRLGNGISEGFYSMGWKEKYSLMYDAPAIYGLYLREDSSDTRQRAIDTLHRLRGHAFPNEPFAGMQFLGRRGGRAEGYGYGDIRINCEDYGGIQSTILEARNNDPITSSGPSSFSAICAYYQYAASANLFDFTEYFCDLKNIKDGECFDPCLSMRYSHGFMPGGKLIGHLSAGKKEGASGPLVSYKITHQGRDIGDGTIEAVQTTLEDFSDDYTLVENENSFGDVVSKIKLRGPASTRYARQIIEGEAEVATPFPTKLQENSAENQKFEDLAYNVGLVSSRLEWSISPREPGGADHCNYLTPIVHVGGNYSPRTNINAFHSHVASTSSSLS